MRCSLDKSLVSLAVASSGNIQLPRAYTRQFPISARLIVSEDVHVAVVTSACKNASCSAEPAYAIYNFIISHSLERR